MRIRFLILLVLFGFIAAIFRTSNSGTGRVASAASVIADADWPQLARDPQRSGVSPQTVSGPYRYYWRWTDVPIATRVQPVVANGILYVGGLTGTLFALDAAYDAQGGPPKILWQQDLHSAIRSGAGVDTTANVVVVGTHGGVIYGLNGTSGQPLWAVTTTGAIVAAPLIANGVAYLGSANGTFYAIRTADGVVLWQSSVGAPILGSAALSGDETTVYVTAENVTAYALSVATGATLWHTQLQGESASDRWPVVAGTSVVFRTMPLPYFHDLLINGDQAMDAAGTRQSNWAADWALVKPQILSYLAANPPTQSFFSLDGTSGASLGAAPVLYTYGLNDAPFEPVYLNGSLYTAYRARHGIQNDAQIDIHVSSKYDAELGQMNPSTLDVTGLTSSDTFGYQFRLTSDEPQAVTVAGSLLLVDSWERLGGINLTSGTNGSLVGIAQVAHNTLPCENNLASNDNLMPFYESCPFIGPAVGEGNTRVGATVASGRIFWQANKSGLASIGPAAGIHDTPQATATPQPTTGPLPGPSPVATPTLVNYVWTAPQRPVASPPPDLTQILSQEVQKIVTANQHMLPFVLQRGMEGTGSWPPDVSNVTEPTLVMNSQAYWYDPGELIYTLSTAYPYLSPTLQSQLLAYLHAEMNRYPPLQSLPYPATSWATQGVAREPYPVPMRASMANAWPPPGVPLQTLYALWAYGQYTGDWAYLSAHWTEIKSLFYSKSGSIDSYAEIAGAIGYARIAQHFGFTTEATAGQNAAVAAMQTGYSFATWLSGANALFLPNGSYYWEPPGRNGPVFFGIVPEVGNYLYDTNLAAVQYTVNDVAGYPNGSYLWYATRLGLEGEIAEASYHSPQIGWSIFLAHAYAMHETQPQLRAWLDRPWGLGDVWYLQKLIATIEAPPTPAYSNTLPVMK